MLSNTSKYAIRAAIFLAMNAKDGANIDIKTIAKALEIPSPFLAKILQILAKQKLLKSAKGPNGGFGLAKDANEISMYEIVTIIDGSDIFDKCLISLRTCNEEEIPCPVHGQFAPIRASIKKLFKEQTLGSLAMAMKDHKGAVTL
ncbi:MAG: Rrf2 family transcriptional regulator [Bacteroidales bacterium]|nr:Rrf2 family transcriptional regulator [Bacteroidales bacterium]